MASKPDTLSAPAQTAGDLNLNYKRAAADADHNKMEARDSFFSNLGKISEESAGEPAPKPAPSPKLLR